MVFHVLSLSHFPDFFRVEASLHLQLLVVLVQLLFSSLVLTHLAGEAALHNLINLRVLLGLLHYFLKRLRQRVLL